MAQTNRYQLAYIFKADKEHIAVELSKIFKLLGAHSSAVTTKYETLIKEDWSHRHGEVWRHEVYGTWYTKRRAEEVRTIINNWIGGE